MSELLDELSLVFDDLAVVLERLVDPGAVVPASLCHAEELGAERVARASARCMSGLVLPGEIFDGPRWRCLCPGCGLSNRRWGAVRWVAVRLFRLPSPSISHRLPFISR